MLRFGAFDRRLNICTTASHMSSNCCALEHHSAVWKKRKSLRKCKRSGRKTSNHNIVCFLKCHLVGLCSGGRSLNLEPVQLLQHGPGRRPVFVRQVEKFRQQLQVVQGQGLGCVQRVLIRARNVALSHVCLHWLLFRRLLLETSWQGPRRRKRMMTHFVFTLPFDII